jgi:hypothetical protein
MVDQFKCPHRERSLDNDPEIASQAVLRPTELCRHALNAGFRISERAGRRALRQNIRLPTTNYHAEEIRVNVGVAVRWR